MSTNIWVGIGNLGDDPVLHTTGSGKSLCRFSIAVDRIYTTGTGDERRQVKEVDWIPVATWGRLAQTCADYLQKGSKVCVKGTLQPSRYTDNEGVTHQTFSINAQDVDFLAKIRSNEEVQQSAVPTVEATP